MQRNGSPEKFIKKDRSYRDTSDLLINFLLQKEMKEMGHFKSFKAVTWLHISPYRVLGIGRHTSRMHLIIRESGIKCSGNRRQRANLSSGMCTALALTCKWDGTRPLVKSVATSSPWIFNLSSVRDYCSRLSFLFLDQSIS